MKLRLNLLNLFPFVSVLVRKATSFREDSQSNASCYFIKQDYLETTVWMNLLCFCIYAKGLTVFCSIQSFKCIYMVDSLGAILEQRASLCVVQSNQDNIFFQDKGRTGIFAYGYCKRLGFLKLRVPFGDASHYICMIYIDLTILPMGTEVWGICENDITISPWQPCTLPMQSHTLDHMGKT